MSKFTNSLQETMTDIGELIGLIIISPLLLFIFLVSLTMIMVIWIVGGEISITKKHGHGKVISYYKWFKKVRVKYE